MNGYGQTMTVSPIFCPKTKKARRPCFKPNCPPHYVAERWGPVRDAFFFFFFFARERSETQVLEREL